MMLPPATRVYLACGFTDMRKGFDGLAAQVQTVLSLDPYGGALFVFRGRRGDRATLCILPFRDLAGGVSCHLASCGSWADGGR